MEWEEMEEDGMRNKNKNQKSKTPYGFSGWGHHPTGKSIIDTLPKMILQRTNIRNLVPYQHVYKANICWFAS